MNHRPMWAILFLVVLCMAQPEPMNYHESAKNFPFFYESVVNRALEVTKAGDEELMKNLKPTLDEELASVIELGENINGHVLSAEFAAEYWFHLKAHVASSVQALHSQIEYLSTSVQEMEKDFKRLQQNGIVSVDDQLEERIFNLVDKRKHEIDCDHLNPFLCHIAPNCAELNREKCTSETGGMCGNCIDGFLEPIGGTPLMPCIDSGIPSTTPSATKTTSWSPTQTPVSPSATFSPSRSSAVSQSSHRSASQSIAPTPTPGSPLNYALELDGSDQYVLVEPPSYPETQSVTMEIWFKISSDAVTHGANAIFTASNQAGTGMGLQVSNLLYLEGFCGNTPTKIISTTKLMKDFWFHAALSYDSSRNRLALYLGGQLEATVTIDGGCQIKDKSIQIGAKGGLHMSKVAVDEPRFWSKARSQAELNAWMFIPLPEAQQSDLWLYYHFDQPRSSGPQCRIFDKVIEHEGDINAVSQGRSITTDQWILSVRPYVQDSSGENEMNQILDAASRVSLDPASGSAPESLSDLWQQIF